MRKIVGILAGASLLCSTSALAVDVYEGNNTAFNKYLFSKGLPACLPSTYSAIVLTEKNGEPSTISPASELQTFERAWTGSEKLLNRFPDGNSLTLYTEKARKWQAVTKATYIDGYSFLQSCVTKFL